MLRELSICPLMALFDLTEWVTIITVELPAHCLFTFVISCSIVLEVGRWQWSVNEPRNNAINGVCSSANFTHECNKEYLQIFKVLGRLCFPQAARRTCTVRLPSTEIRLGVLKLDVGLTVKLRTPQAHWLTASCSNMSIPWIKLLSDPNNDNNLLNGVHYVCSETRDWAHKMIRNRITESCVFCNQWSRQWSTF